MRTLIAEDDFVSRLVLHQFLQRHGTCDLAANGQEAVTAFARAWQCGEPYDLICLDIMMPVMDGQAALREIRRMEQERGIHGSQAVKIIMTTALDDPRNILEAFRSQCEGYLVKPVDERQLIDYLVAFSLCAPDARGDG
jgi:two-component system chemotaxis response regulator CheY